MKASDFIKKLESAIEKFGDLPITGGSILDETVPERICALDADGIEVYDKRGAASFFIE